MNHERISLSATDWINHPERVEREPGTLTLYWYRQCRMYMGRLSSESSLDSGVAEHSCASPSHSCGSLGSGHQVLITKTDTARFSSREDTVLNQNSSVMYSSKHVSWTIVIFTCNWFRLNQAYSLISIVTGCYNSAKTPKVTQQDVNKWCVPGPNSSL